MKNEAAQRFVCYGEARGFCGHQHTTIEEAKVCLREDRAACLMIPGIHAPHTYSDRSVYAASTRNMRRPAARSMVIDGRRFL